MSAPTVVDLVFNVLGSAIPQDHGYALYAAIARVVPGIHAAKDVGIFSIRGPSGGQRLLRVGAASALRLRLSTEKVPALLALAGKPLDVDGHALRVGVPSVVPLIPAPALTSSLVTIKLARPQHGQDFVTPDAVLDAARRKLHEQGGICERAVLPHASLHLPCRRGQRGDVTTAGPEPMNGYLPVNTKANRLGADLRRAVEQHGRHFVTGVTCGLALTAASGYVIVSVMPKGVASYRGPSRRVRIAAPAV